MGETQHRETTVTDLDRIAAIIEERCGICVSDPAEPLRHAVAHSLSFLQILLDIEESFDCALDYSCFSYDVTLKDLLESVKEAQSSAQRGAQGAAAQEPAGSRETPDEIPLNPMQIAYLLGDDPDLELGGQATFIYLETCHWQSEDDVLRAVRHVIGRHDIFTYRPDLVTGTLRRSDGGAAVITSAADGCDYGRDDLLAEASEAHRTGQLLHAHVLPENGGGSRVRWYFAMVVVDAGSLYLLLSELEAVLAGRALPAAQQASIAARRLRERLSHENRELARAYWRRMSSQFPARPSFSQTVDGHQPWRTERLSQRVTSSEAAQLNAAARRWGVSENALLLALHGAVLSRWLGTTGVTVNLTISDRLLADDGHCGAEVGDFTSSMLVGVSPARASSLGECAAMVDREIVDGLAHRGLSGIEVMQEFLRDSAQQTVATAPLVFTSYLGGTSLNVSDTRSLAVVENIYTQTSQVCMDIQLMPADDGFVLSWDYVPAYWSHAHEMFATTVQMVRRVAAGETPWPVVPDATVAAIEQYNATGEAPGDGATLYDLVAEQCAAHPEACAIIDGTRRVTYRDLWEQAGQVACYLQELGCAQGDRVVIDATRCADDLIAMVGVLRAGAVWIPIDAGLPDERKAKIRHRTGAVATLTAAAHADWLMQPDEVTAPPLSSEDCAYIIFTSGSTGEPKGVEISHRGIVGTILDITERCSVGEVSRLVALSSYGFDLSVYDIFGAFCAGCSVTIIHDERDADEILSAVERDAITLWNSAPALLELILIRAAPAARYPSMRTVMLSGDRIPPSLVARAREVFPNAAVLSLGGATEASIWSICIPISEDSFAEGIPYGYPMRGQRVYVLGADGYPCPVGIPGDIWIGGAGVARGYTADPQRTEAAFRDLPGIGRAYFTGDRGVFSQRGYIEFLGRRDRQVKVAGHRIELGEIESIAVTAPGTARAVAGTCRNNCGTLSLFCVVVPSRDASAEDLADAVRGELRRCLPGYMVPTVIDVRRSLPLTGNGKVDYQRLAESVSAGVDSNDTVNLPQETRRASGGVEIPNKLRSLWRRILNGGSEVDELTFFEAGGDSLAFQRLLRLVDTELGMRLHFRDIIVEPTLENLAVLVAAQDPGTEAPDDGRQDTVSARQMGDASGAYDPFPLTDMQQAYLVGRRAGFEYSGMGEHYYLETITEAELGRFEAALNQVIAAHPMLRAVISDNGTQRILPSVRPYRITVKDLRRASEEEIEIDIAQRRDRLSHEVRDLSHWPLFAWEAILLPDGTARLFFSIDLIIGDGTSQQIFLEDLGRAYRGEPLLEQDGTFRDYAIELKKRSANADCKELLGAEEYERVISDFPIGCTLPRRPNSADDPTMVRLGRFFTADEARQLKTTAASLGCSVSALFLAAYAAALTSFSTGTSVGINITTYNRDPDIGAHRNVIGDFTGVVLIPFTDADVTDLGTAALAAQQSLLHHLAAHYPGVRLLGDIARRQHVSGSAAAPFVFTSLLAGDGDERDKGEGETLGETAAVGGTRGRQANAGVLGTVEWAVSQTPQVLIDNQLVAVGDEISLSWDYRVGQLSSQLIEDIFDVYCRTIDSCIAGEPDVAPLTRHQVRRLRCCLAAVKPQDTASDSTVAVEKAPARTALDIVDKALGECGLIEVGLDDNLFECGVDSLNYVALVQRLEKLAGHDIALAVALNAPTRRGLAALIVEKKASASHRPCLTLLREGDPERIVVCLHGGFGTVGIYQSFAAEMPGGYHMWGLSFEEHAAVYPQRVTIEQLAADYAAALRDVMTPTSTIAVVGWSLGGSLAVELAGQLGSRCAGVALLDSVAPGVVVDVGDFSAASEEALLRNVMGGTTQLPPATTNGDVAEIWREAQAHADRGNRAETVRALARHLSPGLLEDLGMSGERVTMTDLNTLRSLVAARNSYRPSAARCPEALLVLPDDGEAHNSRQWAGRGVGTIRVVDVPGNHYSFMLAERAVQTSRLVADYFSERGF